MNENSLTETSQKVERVGWGIIKWMLGIVITFSLLAFSFWLLFYSNFFANLSFIVPLRNWYQNTYWGMESHFLKRQRDYPPFDPIYTTRVYRIEADRTFTFVFLGKFSDIDLPKQIIHLTGYDGNIYAFDISRSLYDDGKGAIWLHVASLENPLIINEKVFPRDNIVNITGIIPFSNKTVFQVYWNDSRTLNQIQSDYVKNGSQAINTGSPKKPDFVQYN